jgi:hypothetical protein
MMSYRPVTVRADPFQREIASHQSCRISRRPAVARLTPIYPYVTSYVDIREVPGTFLDIVRPSHNVSVKLAVEPVLEFSRFMCDPVVQAM